MAFEGAALKIRDDSSERLLIEAAQRDPNRFVDLYEENFERVYAFALRRLRHREDAEDVTAEVFQRALAALPRFEWRGAPFAVWLYRIAANVIHDRAPRTGSESGLRDEPVADSAAGEVEERAFLFRAVEALPDDQRRVIVMRFGEQRPIRDIAAALGRTEGAVKQLQFRALNNLRARLREPHA
jgi:RNA polymerase sigma-70 factor (ECF subfamily)